MGIENVVAESPMTDPHRFGGTTPVPKNNGARRRSARDEEAMQRLHGRLYGWFLQERDKQGENRYQMAVDEDFYDGLQWSDEDAQALMERGQAPLVFNQIKPTINWMLGTERRTRVDGKVLPREEGDEKMAEVKSKLLKYLSDVNRTPFKRSQAWKSCIVAGIGWMEDAVETDPTQELLATRYVDWKQVYHDSCAKEMDLSDARYLHRWSFLDLDIAQAMFPECADFLHAAATDEAQVGMDDDDVWYLGARVNNATSGDFASVSRRGMAGTGLNIGRDRVKVIETWYKVPKACKVCRAHDQEAMALHGEDWNPQDTKMVAAYRDGMISLANHVRMEVRVALMTENRILYEGKSPYKHDRFPLTPMWCYRRHRDGLPYGVIRDLRDAQIDYNKRASKALYILSTVRVVMDADAVDDVEEVREQAALPNGVIVKKKGYDLRIEQDKQLAEEHIKLMMFDGKSIRDAGGVTDQNLGNVEGAMSGKAIGKLQDQGTLVTAPLFDNMRLAIQLQTEIQLSLLEQFYTAPKVVRLVGENMPLDWLKINVYDDAAGKFINDITRSKADFIVDEQDFRASTRQAMFESMMELVAKLPPQVGLAMLDMVIDFADVPNKAELVKRIRQINGQNDPNKKPTPEEQAAREQKQQKDAELADLQEQTLRAQLAKVQGEVENLSAKAQQTAADTKRIVAQAVREGVTAAYEALQAGQIVASVPGTTPVADAILAGAGYEDKGGNAPDIPAPANAPALPMAGAQPPTLPAPDSNQELQQADGAATGIETPTPADNFR